MQTISDFAAQEAQLMTQGWGWGPECRQAALRAAKSEIMCEVLLYENDIYHYLSPCTSLKTVKVNFGWAPNLKWGQTKVTLAFKTVQKCVHACVSHHMLCSHHWSAVHKRTGSYVCVSGRGWLRRFLQLITGHCEVGVGGWVRLGLSVCVCVSVSQVM